MTKSATSAWLMKCFEPLITKSPPFSGPSLRAKVRTESGRDYVVTGTVLSLIPLRNRRTAPDGVALTTRITEGMTEYRCGDLVGYGMSEYLDQILDGRAVGKAAGY
jgi:hypothetical protein